MNPHYPLVSARARFTCEYCRAPEASFNHEFDVDHIRPRARGGDSSEENLALACHTCNLYKGKHVSGMDELTGEEIGLFNPRRDDWHEHFSLNLETWKIEGLTACGRATVARLRMNRDRQILARMTWLSRGMMD